PLFETDTDLVLIECLILKLNGVNMSRVEPVVFSCRLPQDRRKSILGQRGGEHVSSPPVSACMREDSTMRLNAVELIVTLALAILVVALAAEAQQPAKVYRIGWLNLGFPDDTFSKSDQVRPDLDGLRQGLRALGCHIRK